MPFDPSTATVDRADKPKKRMKFQPDTAMPDKEPERISTRFTKEVQEKPTIGQRVQRGLFPLSTAAQEQGAGLLKRNVLAGLDVLTAPTRAFDVATQLVGKGAEKTIKATTGKDVRIGGRPEFLQAVSEFQPGGIDVGGFVRPTLEFLTDPPTYIGLGAIRGAFTPAAKAAEKQMLKQIVTGKAALKKASKATRAAKAQLARFIKKDPTILEEAATPVGREKLRKAGIKLAEGELDILLEDVQRQLSQINIGNIEEAKNTVAGISKALDNQIAQRTQQAQEGVEKVFQQERLLPSERGVQIEQAIEKTRRGAGEAFGKGEEVFLKGKAGAAPIAKVEGKKINIIQGNINDVLKEAGFKKKFRGVERFDNVPATPADIQDAQYFRELAANVETTEDALNQLRLIRRLKGQPKPDGSFYNNVMLGKIDRAYQDAIEKQLVDFTENQGISDNFVELWRENNKRFKQTSEVVSGLKKKLGIGKVPTEAYSNRIKKMGVKELIELKALAAGDEGIALIWNELSDGFFDDMVQKSLRNDGTLDIAKFRRTWDKLDSIDPKVKTVLLGEDKVNNINNAITKFERTEEAVTGLRGAAEEQVKGIERRARVSAIGPELTGQAAKTRLANILGDTGQAQKTRNTLQFLDDFYGTDFVQRAEDLAKARHLEITETGGLPLVTGLSTGRSLLGPVTGAAVAGPSFPARMISTLLGLVGQSPAGGTAMFRAINFLRRGKEAVKATVGTTQGRAGLGLIGVSATERTVGEIP